METGGWSVDSGPVGFVLISTRLFFKGRGLVKKKESKKKQLTQGEASPPSKASIAFTGQAFAEPELIVELRDPEP